MAQRKLAAVTRLFCGEPLETVARELNITVARLSEWRDRALRSAETAMKERECDTRDQELLQLKAKLGEVTMAKAQFAVLFGERFTRAMALPGRSTDRPHTEFPTLPQYRAYSGRQTVQQMGATSVACGLVLAL